MKRAILVLVFGLLAAGFAYADLVTQVSLQSVGKSVEGGIVVNPVTHKAYVIAELDTEGADDYKVVFVIDDEVIRGAKAAKKLTLVTNPALASIKYIPIANEQEYMTIDSSRNLIYIATKYGLAEAESDTEGDTETGESGGADGADANGSGSTPPGPIIRGTLTVIDGNTDTVIATYDFPAGIEPEGVAVDSANSIVYVAAKAPEGEAADDVTCTSGTRIFDVGEPGDVECWTPGRIYAFLIDRANPNGIIRYLKAIIAGDDPESIVFENGMVYAANEDDGTVTIASRVYPDGTGGDLLTDSPQAPTLPYSMGIAPYSLGVFYDYGPNPLSCIENKFEADKMVSGGGSVFITDDRSRVAKITGTSIVTVKDIPGASVCEAIPNSDGGGLNSANNVGYMARGKGILYVVSEQNTVTVIDPATMEKKSTIIVPRAQHLDGIATDPVANRVWLTDENLQSIFILQGACALGVGKCAN